jgi:uncharacterized membrane protein
MSELIVVAFDNESGAKQFEMELKALKNGRRSKWMMPP